MDSDNVWAHGQVWLQEDADSRHHQRPQDESHFGPTWPGLDERRSLPVLNKQASEQITSSPNRALVGLPFISWVAHAGSDGLILVR